VVSDGKEKKSGRTLCKRRKGSPTRPPREAKPKSTARNGCATGGWLPAERRLDESGDEFADVDFDAGGEGFAGGL
jgi:hypothetical protein